LPAPLRRLRPPQPSQTPRFTGAGRPTGWRSRPARSGHLARRATVLALDPPRWPPRPGTPAPDPAGAHRLDGPAADLDRDVVEGERAVLAEPPQGAAVRADAQAHWPVALGVEQPPALLGRSVIEEVGRQVGRKRRRTVPAALDHRLGLGRHCARVAATDPGRDHRRVDPEANFLSYVSNGDTPEVPATRSTDPNRALGQLK
jgi:hypothetical protein